MSKALDAGLVDGEFVALSIAIREIAKQVEGLSNGEPFLAKSLENALATVGGMRRAVEMVEDMPEDSSKHLKKMLDTAEKHVGRIFSPASENMSIPIRH